MAEAVQGRSKARSPRSERRRRSHVVSVRLSDTELAELTRRLVAMNGHLPADASRSSVYSLGRLLRDAALLRPLKVSPASDATSRELAALRANLARAGTLLKTWLERGTGLHGGKGGSLLVIRRPPTGVEAEDGGKALAEIRDLLTTLRTRLTCSPKS